MKRFQYLLFASSIILLVACNNPEKKTEYGKATEELIAMVESNPELKLMLNASIEKASQINSDKNTNPAQSLEEYYEFISWAEKSMPWQFLDGESPSLTTDILQSLVYFYFLNDQPLEELEGNGNYNNSVQYVEPYSSWLVTFNKAWGKYLDTKDSWNDEYYQKALKDESFGLTKGWYEDPANWKTFNEFFARQLKSPDQRPIDSKDDNSIVVSAADAVPQGVWSIDSNSYILAKEDVRVKLEKLNSIEMLIGEESEYEIEFAKGTFIHSFLSVNDYHHYHFPLSGTVREVRIIPGNNAIGSTITWDSVSKMYGGDVSGIGWQTVETRGCIILETEDFGLVALMPIGMAQVNSVNFEENLEPGTKVTKGDIMGHFLFGGSDFIMIFQEKARFVLDAPKTEDGESYEHRLMGERLGYFARN